MSGKREAPETKKSNKKSGWYMKLCVAVIIAQVIAFAWVSLYLSYKVGMEIAPTTTVGFFGFCGAEAGICGMIKKNGASTTD